MPNTLFLAWSLGLKRWWSKFYYWKITGLHSTWIKNFKQRVEKKYCASINCIWLFTSNRNKTLQDWDNRILITSSDSNNDWNHNIWKLDPPNYRENENSWMRLESFTSFLKHKCRHCGSIKSIYAYQLRLKALWIKVISQALWIKIRD